MVKFGGTGADGALAISSGTTTIDLSNAAVVVKNYTSISITGTGALAFSNPHTNGTLIILKSQGGVTITSSANPTIDIRSMGAASATGGQTSLFWKTGTGGTGTSANPGQGGAAGTTDASGLSLHVANKLIPMGCGAGGGVGGASDNGTNVGGGGGGGASFLTNASAGSAATAGSATAGTGGAGGRGAGALYIECGGALSISSVINAAGTAGSAGTHSTSGAGGGGGGGTILILYTTLTANTGTYTVTGGSGGASGGLGGAGGAGANGSSLVAANTEFA